MVFFVKVPGLNLIMDTGNTFHGVVVLIQFCYLIYSSTSSLQDKKLLSDSGNIIDKRYRGGRLGMYAYSQTGVYYSALFAGSPEVRISVVLLGRTVS